MRALRVAYTKLSSCWSRKREQAYALALFKQALPQIIAAFAAVLDGVADKFMDGGLGRGESLDQFHKSDSDLLVPL